MAQLDRREFLRLSSLALASAGGASADTPKPAQPRKLQVVVLEGSAHERGLVHGKTLKTQIHELIKLWKADLADRYKMTADAFIKRFVKQTDYLSAIKKWTPDLLDEIKGIAEGAGLDFDTMLVFQCMDEYWANGDALAADHCSGLGWPKRDGSTTHIAQNMDLEGFRNGYQVLLHIKHPGADLETVVVSNAGLIGWNGMNNKGIGICCNTLLQLSNCRDGLPVNCVMRGVLQQKTEEDAVKFVHQVKHASGQNYIVGGPRGVHCLECSAGKVSPFKPDEKRGLVWHTNHPLANDDYNAKYREKKTDKPPEDSTSARLRCLETRLNQGTPVLGMDLIKTILASHDSAEFPVCRPLQNKKDNFTFACTIMVLADKPELHVAPGPPDQTPFQIFSFSR
jgi:isopenicillin-N N-acyltransferase like protein